MTVKKDKSSRNTKKGKLEPKVNVFVKPDGMSLDDWQCAIRRQSAKNEKMVLSYVDKKRSLSDFQVENLSSKRIYKTVFYGVGSEWNYCSCMDFKTNHLGTCKHLEFVRNYIADNRLRVGHELPAYSSVYLSYVKDRQVKIRRGSSCSEKLLSLSNDYFDEDCNLKSSVSYLDFLDFYASAIRIDDTFRVYDDAKDYLREAYDRDRRCRMLEESYPDGKFSSVLMAKLYPYQNEGIRFAVRQGKSIIADEMGLGKTIQAIGVAEVLKKFKLITSAIIVCPTSLKYQWKREIEKFTDSDCVVVEGDHLKRKTLYEAAPFYKIVSYNAISNDLKILRRIDTDFLIMDEAQRLKNWNTQIARNMKNVQSAYTVVLTGTPLENKLEEFYAIMEYVDQFCLGPFHQFMNRYVLTNESGKVFGYQHLNEISEKMGDALIRRNKKQVELQLPPRTDKILMVQMTKEQREVHDECKVSVSQIVTKWNRLHFLSEKDRKRLLVLLSQMRMVCDSTYVLDQISRNDTKIEELMSIVKELVDGGNQKMVVFSQWERMTRLVVKELDEAGIQYEYLHGGVPSSKRKDMVVNFTERPECRIFVSTDAGSTGLNLQAASVIVNLDLPWNPAVLEQRIARIFRIGQKSNIQVLNFVSQNTIEEDMLSKLNFKSNMFSGILDGGKDEVLLEDSKMEKLMQAVGVIVSEDENNSLQNADDLSDSVYETTNTNSTVSDFVTSTMTDDDDVQDADMIRSSVGKFEGNKENVVVADPQDVVQQGVSFLTGLSQILSSPEKTRQLVDSLVEEDKETGKATLKIPIPDKSAVLNMFSLLGNLMKQ